MKETIPFDIQYRPQIESGEYDIVTRDNRPVKILRWNFTDHSQARIHIIVDNLPFDVGLDGKYLYGIESPIDLFVVRNKKPKFKVGVWVTNGEYTWKIEGIHGKYYDIVDTSGRVTDYTISHIDNDFHLWTIDDAKDGEVIHMKRKDASFADSGWLCAFKNKDEKGRIWSYAAIHLYENFYTEKDSYLPEDGFDIRPVIIEEKRYFLETMDILGCKWDKSKVLVKEKEISANEETDNSDAYLLKDIINSYVDSNSHITLNVAKFILKQLSGLKK